MTLGSITRFGEVNTKKDRSKSKAAAKDTSATLVEATNTTRPPRASRGGAESGRGGRGRGSDRGGRGGRGRGAAVTQTNGARPKETAELSTPTEDAWGTPEKKETTEETSTAESWGAAAVETASAATAAVTSAASSLIPDGAKKSWASMFAAPKPAPAAKKSSPAETKQETPATDLTAVEAPAESTADVPTIPDVEEATQKTPTLPPTTDSASITPTKDELTETNLEQLPDTSVPAPTDTAASTAASSWDPRQTSSYSNQPSAIRPPTSGFAASAQKATGTPGRLPSFQRRVLDQEEAVRMPGNREVDRAAVQFGAFNLGSEEDVDGDREDTETRAQPPQHSPVAHPRAALPPAQAGLPAALPSPQEATGLPSAPSAAPGLPSPQPQQSAQTTAQQGQSSQYGAYGRYGQAGAQPEPSFGGKPYDAFSQQAPSVQSGYDSYPGQQGSQSQHTGAFSSAPNDYSSYYSSNPQQQSRDYSQYYGGYGQQAGAQSQDGSASQQRGAGGYNTSSVENTSQYPQSSASQTQGRYGASADAQNSGHNTPAPSSQTQQSGPPGQSQQGGQHQAGPGQYPYGHPYYSSPYYAAYVNQAYGQGGYGQGGYGGGGYGKGGMYGQQHGYGMPPQAPYDHAASPAAGRDSAVGGGLGDYGRAGSQPSSQAHGAGSYSGINNDSFNRNAYQSQGHNYGQQGQQGGIDDLKPYGEGKSANGPSPLLSQAARPGSAANNGAQSTLPPPQSSQPGYGQYPNHLQSQYGGLGGANNGHQYSQYGNYGGFGASNSYGGNQQRGGGWGSQYGH